jgi:hypothetical protein
MAAQNTDWHDLAEQASRELDPVKLLCLVNELNRALVQNERTSQRLQWLKNPLRIFLPA